MCTRWLLPTFRHHQGHSAKNWNLAFQENFLKLSSDSIKWDSISWQTFWGKSGVSWLTRKKSEFSGILGNRFFPRNPDSGILLRNSWGYYYSSFLAISKHVFACLPNITVCHSPVGNQCLPPSPALFDISCLSSLVVALSLQPCPQFYHQ
jgi:hypothetical protein